MKRPRWEIPNVPLRSPKGQRYPLWCPPTLHSAPFRPAAAPSPAGRWHGRTLSRACGAAQRAGPKLQTPGGTDASRATGTTAVGGLSEGRTSDWRGQETNLPHVPSKALPLRHKLVSVLRGRTCWVRAGGWGETQCTHGESGQRRTAFCLFQRAEGATEGAAGRVGSFMLCHKKSRKVAACSVRLSR